MQPPTVPCPERIEPQLVTLVSRPPARAWRYEIKYDGYKMLARIDSSVQLFIKNGYNWTGRIPRPAASAFGRPRLSRWPSRRCNQSLVIMHRGEIDIYQLPGNRSGFTIVFQFNGRSVDL